MTPPLTAFVPSLPALPPSESGMQCPFATFTLTQAG
jgi:hypothetical protein